MIKKNLFIFLGVIFLFHGCKKETYHEFEIELTDGETAVLRVYDNTIKILNGENLVTEISILSSAYYVTCYSNGLPSVITAYEKGERTPVYVNRVVVRDGVEYYLTYDDDGKIKEEVLVEEREK